jgi:hypothetical protein
VYVGGGGYYEPPTPKIAPVAPIIRTRVLVEENCSTLCNLTERVLKLEELVMKLEARIEVLEGKK